VNCKGVFDGWRRAAAPSEVGHNASEPELRYASGNHGGDGPKRPIDHDLDYLWPYRNPATGYRGADPYYYAPNGYPARGYAGRDYLAPYRNPARGYGRPTYPGVRRGPAYPYYGGYSPYVPYQDRGGAGRAFRYSAPPTYQPRLGGTFDR
jgi:hypothetical protein